MKLLLCVVVLLCVEWSDASGEPSKVRKQEKNKAGDEVQHKTSEEDKYNCEHKVNQGFVDDNEQLYHSIDIDGDGDVSPHELRDFYKKAPFADGKPIHISLQKAEQMINEGDLDKNGKFTKDEWIQRIVNKAMKERGFDDTFMVFDVDGNNKITKTELTTIFAKGGHKKEAEELASFIIEVLDCDFNNHLSYEEFKGFFRHQFGKDKEEEEED